MGRPKKQHAKNNAPAPGEPNAPPPNATAAGEQPAGSAHTQQGEPERIEIRLDEKGRIQPMRDETRERLRRALETSDLGPGFEPQPTARFIDEAFAGRLLDGLAAAQGLIFSKAARVPHKQATEIMRFETDERKTLAVPTAAVLNAYAGSWLTRHGPLVEFGIKFAAIEAGKFDRAVALAREYREKKEAQQ